VTGGIELGRGLKTRPWCILGRMNGETIDVAALVHDIARVLEPRPEILEAYLFGSVARGEARPHSDIDVAVFVDTERCPDAPYGYPAALTTDLMAGLHTNAIDVVVLNHAPPLLYHRVLRDGIRILSRDLRATTTREARAFSRYFDYLPQLAKIETALRGPSGTRFSP